MDAKIITEKQSCLSSYMPASWEAAVANSPCGNRTQALGIDKSFVIMGFTRTYPKMVT